MPEVAGTDYQWALIGEVRYASLSRGRIRQMRIMRDGESTVAGCRSDARVVKIVGHQAIVQLETEQAILFPVPKSLTEGTHLRVEVTRSAWREPGRDRLARVRPARHMETHSSRTETLEILPSHLQEEWEERYAEAQTGMASFEGATLIFSQTPAFLAVDVDMAGPISLDVALRTLAYHIILWNIGGIVIVDLPAADKAMRHHALEVFDRTMGDDPFERTSINGFGILQIVLPRRGPSILDHARLDQDGSDAIFLLNQAADNHVGPTRLVGRPGVVHWIEKRRHLLDQLEMRIGGKVQLLVKEGAGRGHVEPYGPTASSTRRISEKSGICAEGG